MVSNSELGLETGDDRTVDVGPPSERGGRLEESLELPSGAEIGRYMVEAQLGVGGMGAVYRARDPELDRAVALKILHIGTGIGDSVPSAGSRMVLEAQVLAKLEHPNVVQVFDAGLVQGRLFIVMELVEGWTLSKWIREVEPTTEQVLAACVAAGRGLEAAHQSQVIHRDFKPSNVLVGRDGRVKVVDFGLARQAGEGSPRVVSEGDGASWQSGDASLTQTGTVMGTPRYMAPEQHEGKQVDKLADQFGFCVTTWVALYGEPPFVGDMNSLFVAKSKGRLATPPPGIAVASEVHAALVRGLAPEPDDRWPSMTELLDVLARDHGRARRRRRAIWLTIGAVAALGVGLSMWGRDDELCASSASLAAQVWNPAVAERIGTAFDSTGTPLAPDAWARTRSAIDDYVTEWIARRDEACRASVASDDVPVDLLDRGMHCYGRRLDEVHALLGVLEAPDPEVVERSQLAVVSLPSLEACDDPDRLRAEVSPPSDPETARAAEDIRRRLSGVSAMLRAGQPTEAADEVAETLASARELDYAPVLAEALLAAGVCRHQLGDGVGARQMLEEAYFVAERLNASDAMTRSAIRLLVVVGVDLAEHDTGREWARHASAALQRHRGDLQLESSYHDNLGLLAKAEGKYEQALESHRRALELLEQAVGPKDLALRRPLTNISSTLSFVDRNREALPIAQRTLELTLEAMGPDHPATAKARNNLGGIYVRLGEVEAAEKQFLAALEIRRRVFGPDHLQVGTTLVNLTQVRSQQGRHREAVEGIREALPILERHLGPEHPHVAGTLYNLGLNEESLGEYDAALADLRRSLAIRQKILPAGHPDVAMSQFHLADVLLTTGETEDALALYGQAVSTLEAALGPDHVVLSFALLGQGRALLALGRAADAVPLLERAARIRHEVEDDPALVAETDSELAKARAEANANASAK